MGVHVRASPEVLIPARIPQWFREQYSIDDSVRFIYHPSYWEQAIIQNEHWIKVEALFREAIEGLDENARNIKIIVKDDILLMFDTSGSREGFEFLIEDRRNTPWYKECAHPPSP